jgi:uncharacterized protein with NAD-binding domain and iron-sulfur cluster
MNAQHRREKVAVLGGGPAAVTAAFELTATPELRDRFEVTVHQLGWRLGGKCASGRNPERSWRIEEHGLHVWFGFYDNAFRAMRAAYDELDRPPGHPLATLEDAFKGCDEVVLYDRQGDGWESFALVAPPNGQTPGADAGLPDFWEIAERGCRWAIERWDSLTDERPEISNAAAQHRRLSPAWMLDAAATLGAGAGVVGRGGENLLHLAHHVARTGRQLGALPRPLALPGVVKRGPLGQPWSEHLLAILLTRFRDWLWDFVVRDRCQQDPHLRLFFTIFDTFASAAIGVVEDGVLEHGWEEINDRELCEWLASHGAKQVTVGATPELRSPLLRSIYDVAFGYPEGVIANANVAAGTAINDLLRLMFSYRGSLIYKMQAGMGDTVLTPFYEVLQRRGVKFEFFHAVTDLDVSDDGLLLDSIEVVPQVELTDGAYDPLVDVEGLECWPSEPCWEQLKDGERLKREAVDFESEPNPLKRKALTLRRGVDFDSVVLGIPVGALPRLCAKIAKRHTRFQRMLDSAVTVRTQAFQLWLSKTTPELGWAHGTDSVVGCYVEPLDTWCDMSHLIPREGWSKADGVHGIAYFCGVLDERKGESQAAASARAKDNARAFLEGDIGTLWPQSLRPSSGAFDWPLLIDRTRARGAARLDSQYWRANVSDSERYVLTPAGSVADRLGADESGVGNLVLAGDWTRNGIDGGCVEAAMTSGMQAARALIGHERTFSGESPTWLTDPPAGPTRGARARPTARASPAAGAARPTSTSPPGSARGQPTSLPPYIEYGTRATTPPPFASSKGRLQGLVLQGDHARITALCDNVFNAAADGVVEYRPLSDHVLMLTGSFGEVSSLAPGFQDMGFVTETQVSLWLVLAAGHRDGSTFVDDHMCLAVPYIFVDNPMSYLGGREDYGYPKAMGRFDPSDGVGDPVRIEVYGGDFAPHNQAGWHPLLELSRVGDDDTAASHSPVPDAPPDSWRPAREFVSQLLHPPASAGAPSAWPELAFIESVIDDLLDSTARQLFLKQFRDAAICGSACYQAVVEAPVKATSASVLPSLREWQLTVHELDSHPIARELGVTTQTTRLTFELELSMVVEPGVIVAP